MIELESIFNLQNNKCFREVVAGMKDILAAPTPFAVHGCEGEEKCELSDAVAEKQPTKKSATGGKKKKRSPTKHRGKRQVLRNTKALKCAGKQKGKAKPAKSARPVARPLAGSSKGPENPSSDGYCPHEFSRKRKEFIQKVREEQNVSFREANDMWTQSHERISYISNLSVQEQKRRRFA